MKRALIISETELTAQIVACALHRLVPHISLSIAPTDTQTPGADMAVTSPLLRDFHAALGLSEADFLAATHAVPAMELAVGNRRLPYGEPGLGLYGDRFWPVHAALQSKGKAGPAEDYSLSVAASRAGKMADIPADMRAMFDYGYSVPMSAYLNWLQMRGQTTRVPVTDQALITIEVRGAQGFLPLDLAAVQGLRVAAMLRAGTWDDEQHRRQTAAEIDAAQDLAALLSGDTLPATAAQRLKIWRDEGRRLPGAPFPQSLWAAALWPYVKDQVARGQVAFDLTAEAASFARMAILIEQSVATMPSLSEWEAALLRRP